eukprot:TRINITY_DN4353_c1_g3_i1.p1 TRINITY_DN4353_c1_g3~~TRINITY_DN4353_c1_g3_i1.p1  ORF type:complete len:169 (+),score=55.98 TRINITY_DN4353_c1_g3_i1:75-581(+)
MGNCGSAPGPGGKKSQEAPVPKLDPKMLGLSTREANAAGRFKTLQETYATMKDKMAKDDKREAEKKTPEAMHKDLMEEKTIKEQIDDVVTDLDRELKLTDKAGKAQNEMMQEMGEDNPDNKVPDVPGASAAWNKAKKEAQKKAVKETCTAFLGQELLASQQVVAEATS